MTCHSRNANICLRINLSGSSLLEEIYKLAYQCSSIPNVISPSYQKVETDNGLLYAFSLRASYAPEDDDLIEVTDEELLKKLRSIKGQGFSGEVPGLLLRLVKWSALCFTRT